MDEILTDFVKQAADDLQQFSSFQQEVEGLECDYDGIRRLVQIGIQLHKDLVEQSKERMFSVGEGTILDGLPYVAASVRQQLVLHHFHLAFNSKATPEDVLREAKGEFTAFLELIRELDEAGANTRKLFQIALTKPELSMYLLWQGWMKRFEVVKKKANEFKKLIGSHRNLTSSYRELTSGIRKAIEAEYEETVRLLNAVKEPTHLKEWKPEYSAPGGNLSKNLQWRPILKRLEEELAQIYKPVRHWEKPGGLPGEAISGKVYETLNKILHYCYPSIWSLNSVMTGRIKSRCHQSPSPTS